jgi:long-chain acyl-CoA synthetase
MDIRLIPDVVPELLRLRSQQDPQQVAFYGLSPAGMWRSKTWAEYWDEVDRAATTLHEWGLAQGDLVAIFLPTSPAWELAQQAALTIGAVIVGLDPRASRDEIAWILQHSQANWLVLPESGLDAIPGELLESLQGVIVLSRGQPDRQANRLWFQDLLTPRSVAGLGAAQLRQRRADDVATILYTSGTTGEPKGIEVTHGQMMVAVRSIAAAFLELTADDTTICWLPMAALFQRMVNLLSAARGMATYFVEDPRQILDRLSEVAPTFFVGVPRFYEKLQQVLQQTDEAASASWRRRVKCMVSGSAPLARPVMEYLHQQGLLVLEAYGLSENTVPMAINRLDGYRFGSVGRPRPENDIRFDADGELLVKGPGVFRGYFREPRPADRFTEDGYYRTGDCGYLDEDGFLYLVGRKSEIIKTSTGRRIAPVGIEGVYAESPYLDQVVVLGDGRKHLVALLTLNLPPIERYLRERGAPPELRDARATAIVQDLVLGELERLDSGLAAHERVQAVGVLSRPFSLERGEITMGAKLKRAVIAVNYQTLIDKLYTADRRCVLVDWAKP